MGVVLICGLFSLCCLIFYFRCRLRTGSTGAVTLFSYSTLFRSGVVDVGSGGVYVASAVSGSVLLGSGDSSGGGGESGVVRLSSGDAASGVGGDVYVGVGSRDRKSVG